MRTSRHVLLLLLLLGVLAALRGFAQQPSPSPSPLPSPDAVALPESSPSGGQPFEPAPLMPNSFRASPPAPVAVPKPEQPYLPYPSAQSTPAPSPAALSKTETNVEQVRLGIRMFQARTLALRDPAIQAQIAWAEAARTDEGKRERRVRYYKMLYARITKIDPSLASLAATQQAAVIAGVVQHNIQQSVMLERD